LRATITPNVPLRRRAGGGPGGLKSMSRID
jgi:hypothetical protein